MEDHSLENFSSRLIVGSADKSYIKYMKDFYTKLNQRIKIILKKESIYIAPTIKKQFDHIDHNFN